MGMFDDITAWVICDECGKRQKSALQTKDFDRLLDHLGQGDDTRKKIDRWFLHDSSLGRGEGKYEELIEKVKKAPKWLGKIKYTREGCRPMKITEVREKYGNEKKYRLDVHLFKHWKTKKRELSWWCYKRIIKCGRTSFDGIRNRDFNCYTSCKGCGKWLECRGYIKNYVFTGVQVDPQMTKEAQKHYIRRKVEKKK